MIHGIGTDLVVISRLAMIFDRFGDKLAAKILAPAELKSLALALDKPRFLAKRFAAKEAFAKALGTGFRGFWFTDVEVFHDQLGKPNIRVHGRCHSIYKNTKIKSTHLSVTDEKDLAQAFVVLEI